MSGIIDNTLYLPGGFKTKKLEIEGEKVLGLLLEMNIYESLTANVITADLTLADAHNLVSNIPIKEGTLVDVEFTNLPDDTNVPETGSIAHKFEVVKIINRKTLKQDLQVYTLVLASSGWSKNIYTRISRSYFQKRYSEIVSDIYFKDWSPETGLNGSLDKKGIFIEETDGMYNVVIPRWTPLTCFNWLASRSIRKKACNFLFWEDLQNLNFSSVEKLLKKGPVATYYHQTENTTANDKSTSYFNVEEVNFRDTKDILFFGMNGMIGNRMIEVDFIKKTITDFSEEGKDGGHVVLDEVFDYQSSFGSISHADDGSPLIESSITDKFKNNSKFTVLPRHSWLHNDMEHYEQEKWFRERLSQRASIDYFGLDILSIGSFKRKVGDKIEFKYHSPESQEQSPILDKQVSGNYLVKAIRRKFNQKTYMMVMDIIKDNTLE